MVSYGLVPNRHQTMMTSSNGNIFRVTGHLCWEFPAQRPVTRSFDVFFDLRLNEQRLSKQSWGWWFETPTRPLWRHSNAVGNHHADSTGAKHIDKSYLGIYKLRYSFWTNRLFEKRQGTVIRWFLYSWRVYLRTTISWRVYLRTAITFLRAIYM